MKHVISHILFWFFWVFCGLPPLNLRGGVEGLLSASVQTGRFPYLATPHGSKTALPQPPTLSDILNELPHTSYFRTGCAVHRPILLQVSWLDSRSLKYRTQYCIDEKISFHRTACFSGVPRGSSPPQSDCASTPVAVALMLDHSEGISHEGTDQIRRIIVNAML